MVGPSGVFGVHCRSVWGRKPGLKIRFLWSITLSERTTPMTTKTTRFTLSLAALTAFSACAPEGELLEDSLGETEQAVYDPANPPNPVATDDCNDSTHAGQTWSSTSSAHLVAWTLPGTDAEGDVAGILAAREAAYTDITTRLGITSNPTINVYLSPNRLAAAQHGKSFGGAFPGQDRVEVVYTGSPNGFETLRPGNLLTRALEYHIDTANPKRVPLLSVGLAEVLDQSGRDLHDAYAQNLQAGTETRVRIASFDSGDVTGRNVGRAGSLVKFLIDSYGMPAFLDIFKATAVASASGCAMRSTVYGCINSATALTNMLDGVISAQTGDSWATVAAAWKAEVDSHLATVNLSLPRADRDAIKNLVNLMDQAIITDDAATYRSTMEGFYCDWTGEAGRTDIAARTVDAYQSTQSNIVRIYPTGVSNFTTARVAVRRIDERGIATFFNLSFEKLPQGWRVTYGPDWW
jgi:hypothetical protein